MSITNMFACEGKTGRVTPDSPDIADRIRSWFARVVARTAGNQCDLVERPAAAATWARTFTPRSLVLYRRACWMRSSGPTIPPRRRPARPQFLETDQAVSVRSG